MRLNSITLASRQSDLAKIQAYMVAQELKKAWPGLEVRHHFRESLGDINLTDPLWKIPERGVFTEDFVEGLKKGDFDAVVHSWKDLPTENRPGAEIIATLPRADVRDIVLLRKDLPAGGHWRILSSSPRRAHNLADFFHTYLPVHPDKVEFLSVRGNVPRRIEKLVQGEGDGLILAKAALDRLLDASLLKDQGAEFADMQERLKKALQNFWLIVLPLELNPPAAAQGALAIEIRSDRDDLKNIFSRINCPKTMASIIWERKRLADYGGGCHLKIGLWHHSLTGAKALGEDPRPNATPAPMAADLSAEITIERGQTPAGENFFHRKLKLVRDAKPARLPNPRLLAIRSEDYFKSVHRPLSPSQLDLLLQSPVLVTHRRALSPELTHELAKRTPQSPWIWTSGLESWKKLAALGLWVRGCDEGLGSRIYSTDDLDRLQTSQLESHSSTSPLRWCRLTHQTPGESPLPQQEILTSYELELEKPEAFLAALQSADCFYWRSPSHLQLALQMAPEIRRKEHATGPGASLSAIEALLGRSLRHQVFLSESDWRNSFEPPSSHQD